MRQDFAAFYDNSNCTGMRLNTMNLGGIKGFSSKALTDRPRDSMFNDSESKGES